MILFYGDPHGEWRPLHAAAAKMTPAAIIVLGAMELDHPFEEEVADRADFLAKLVPEERWQGGLPLRPRVSIWPEDVAALARERADILITHEAPSTMRRAGRPIGFRVLDDLAGQMGVSLVVHGHHHVDYGARLPSGIAVRGIGRASTWPLARRAAQANISG